jgi:hypothetical protein
MGGSRRAPVRRAIRQCDRAREDGMRCIFPLGRRVLRPLALGVSFGWRLRLAHSSCPAAPDCLAGCRRLLQTLQRGVNSGLANRNVTVLLAVAALSHPSAGLTECKLHPLGLMGSCLPKLPIASLRSTLIWPSFRKRSCPRRRPVGSVVLILPRVSVWDFMGEPPQVTLHLTHSGDSVTCKARLPPPP